MKRWLYPVLLLSGLAGCAAPGDYEQARQQAQARLAEAYQQVSPSPTRNHVVQHQGYFVPPLLTAVEGQPGWFNEQVDFAVDGISLQAVMRDLLSPYGVAVRYLDQIDKTQPVQLYFQGSLGDALQQVSLLTGYHLDAQEHMVSVRRFEMAEFDIAFLAGTTNFFLGDTAEHAGANRAASNSFMMAAVVNEESSQYLNFTSEALSVWDDLYNALNLLVSEHGQIALNQSSTSILVRDYPQYVEQVRAYLLQQNRRLTRQVAVDVQIIDVAFDDQSQVGIDWELLYQTARHSGIVNFSAAGGANSSPSVAGVRRDSGRFSGSQAFIEALSQQGVVEVSSHPRIVTLNNQISKIVLEDNATYLASAGSSATANVGSSDLLIPGVVTTGFELYLLPKVANTQVVMQLSTSLSDLKAIDEVSSGDKTIQTPHTNRKKFFMKAMVGDGETLLISGLKSTRNQWQERRTAGSWLFGGRRSQQRQHSETLLLLTPRILETGVML